MRQQRRKWCRPTSVSHGVRKRIVHRTTHRLALGELFKAKVSSHAWRPEDTAVPGEGEGALWVGDGGENERIHVECPRSPVFGLVDAPA